MRGGSAQGRRKDRYPRAARARMFGMQHGSTCAHLRERAKGLPHGLDVTIHVLAQHVSKKLHELGAVPRALVARARQHGGPEAILQLSRQTRVFFLCGCAAPRARWIRRRGRRSVRHSGWLRGCKIHIIPDSLDESKRCSREPHFLQPRACHGVRPRCRCKIAHHRLAGKVQKMRQHRRAITVRAVLAKHRAERHRLRVGRARCNARRHSCDGGTVVVLRESAHGCEQRVSRQLVERPARSSSMRMAPVL